MIAHKNLDSIMRRENTIQEAAANPKDKELQTVAAISGTAGRMECLPPRS